MTLLATLSAIGALPLKRGYVFSPCGLVASVDPPRWWRLRGGGADFLHPGWTRRADWVGR
jgi:hypothetical protein